ncbi:MAG: hypothetical protein RQ715_11425 [Methylococcales bacterium]|nr:hypothetical protein [Methylococcales bacterium]
MTLKLIPLAFLAALFSSAIQAQSFHQDIALTAQGERIVADFCTDPEAGCDMIGIEQLGLPTGTVPTDYLTGNKLFISGFSEFPSTISTDNPGFQAFPGALQGGERISYRARGHLNYFDPEQNTWTAAPDTMQVRLAGGLDVQPNQDCGLVFCPPNVQESFTVFTATGISGAQSLIVNEVPQNGAFHSHLDWFLESQTGTVGGPDGAYLVELNLFSDQRSEDSEPLSVLLSHRLPDDVLADAVARRVLPHLEGRVDALFDWAQAQFPQLFPHPAASEYLFGYYARCYNNAVCVGVRDGAAWATGGAFGVGVVRLGALAELLDLSGL